MSDSDSKLWYLENFNLFDEMSKDELMEVEKKTRMKIYNKGQYIYFPDDTSNYLFFLKTGRVKLCSYSEDGKEIIKAILWPGEIFGEIGLIGNDKRNDYAQPLDDDVLLCTMRKDDMKMMMKMNPSLNFRIMKLIGLRFRKIERKLESLIFKDARTRIVDLIKDLAEERGKKLGTDIFVKHYLTHQDFAYLTATSRQNVTTIFNELKTKGIIDFERKSFIIRNFSKLK